MTQALLRKLFGAELEKKVGERALVSRELFDNGW